MSNYYLCDACERRRDSIPDEICEYRAKQSGKIVHSDEDPRSREEICKRFKTVKR